MEQKDYNIKSLLKSLGGLSLQIHTKETVLSAICNMDTDLLNIILDDSITYQDTTKNIFLDRLELVFKKFREQDKYLIPHNGQCNSDLCSNTNKKGISFMGNVSVDYLNLILETDSNNIVTDIYQCYSFCPKSFEFNPTKRGHFIKIYEDEKLNFEISEEYTIQNAEAQKALNELQSFTKSVMPFDYVKIWVGQYANLRVKVKYNLTIKSFHIFNRYYESIHSIVKWNKLNDRATLAFDEYSTVNVNDELTILKWIVKHEKLNNEIGYCGYRLKQNDNMSQVVYKFHSELSVYFKLENIVAVIQFFSVFREVYWPMLDKYTTLSEDEQNNIHLLRDEEIDLAYNLSFHLKKRGIIT